VEMQRQTHAQEEEETKYTWRWREKREGGERCKRTKGAVV